MKPTARSISLRPMKTAVFDSIQGVPEADWNCLLENRHVTHSREFWQVVEQAGLNDFDYRHVLFYDDDGQPVGLASLYTVTTDIAIFAGGGLKALLERVRRVFPNFLKLRMLECGTPITLNRPFVSSGDEVEAKVVSALHELIRQIMKREGQRLVVIRDFEAGTEQAQAQLQELGYQVVDALPNTFMDIRWQNAEAYIKSMKSYFRSKLRKHLRRNTDRGIRYELHDDFDHLADLLCRQWLTVYSQADEYQREVLTPAFYRELSVLLGERSKVLLFYREDELIGHALLVLDGDLLRWLYFGRNEAVNDSLYIYVTHKVIKTAIDLGVKRLALGVTTYSIKKDLGAQMYPMRLALGLRWSFLNPFIGWVYPLINHIPPLNNKMIFKE